MVHGMFMLRLCHCGQDLLIADSINNISIEIFELFRTSAFVFSLNLEVGIMFMALLMKIFIWLSFPFYLDCFSFI